LQENNLSRRKIWKRRQVYFKQASFLQLKFGIREDLSRPVAASHSRRIEPEFGGVPGGKTELLPFDKEF
jgi:hypothetical protein